MTTHTARYSGPATFSSQQIFFQSSYTGKDNGWYVSVSDARCYGPFREKEVALYILNGLKKRLKATQQREQASNFHKQLLSDAPFAANNAA